MKDNNRMSVLQKEVQYSLSTLDDTLDVGQLWSYLQHLNGIRHRVYWSISHALPTQPHSIVELQLILDFYGKGLASGSICEIGLGGIYEGVVPLAEFITKHDMERRVPNKTILNELNDPLTMLLQVLDREVEGVETEYEVFFQ